MKHFASLLSVAALACGVLAQEIDDCADMCIRRAIDVGIEAGCRNERDLDCLCEEPAVGETVRECVYSECDQEGIDDAIDYALEICEYAGVPITIETGRPTTGTFATAEPTAAPEPTEEPEVPEPTEEPEAPVDPPKPTEEEEEPEAPEPTGGSCRGGRGRGRD